MRSLAPPQGVNWEMSPQEFVSGIFTNIKDPDEFITRAPCSKWISDVIVKFHDEFNRSASLPLTRLAIIHFLSNHKEIQHLVDKQNRIVDNFASLLESGQRRQRSFVFRAVAAVSPLVRRDSLFLMKAIDCINSRDPEVVRAAGDTLRVLCQESKACCKAVLSLVQMPELLRFLPDMKHTRKLQSRAVAVFRKYMTIECPFLKRLLTKSMVFVENIGWFHNVLFDGYIKMLRELTDVEFCCFCFDLLSKYSKYLYPEQIGWLGRFTIDFLLNAPQASYDQSIPLKFLSTLKVTSAKLCEFEPNSLLCIGYWMSCLPRGGSDTGNLAVGMIERHLDTKCTKDAVSLIFANLTLFVSSLSDNWHSALVDKVIPRMSKLGFQNQVADFLLSIPMELAPMYIIDLTGVTIRSKLKAAILRLHYLADVEPNFRIEPKDGMLCGCALFQIGAYKEAANCFKLCPNNKRAECYMFLSLGLASARDKDYSNAVAHLQHTMDLFKAFLPIHDFHVMFVEGLSYYYSICFQGSLLYVSYMNITEDTGSWLMGCDELRNILFKVTNSSLLLHPNVDINSRNIVIEYTHKGVELIESFGKDRARFEELCTDNIMIPPCLLSIEIPVSVEDLRVSKQELTITQSNDRRVMLSLSGKVTNKTHLNLKIFCEVAFSFEGMLRRATSEQISEGNFELDFPLLVEDSCQLAYVVPLTITFTAETEDRAIYLIGYFTRNIEVVESQRS